MNVVTRCGIKTYLIRDTGIADNGTAHFDLPLLYLTPNRKRVRSFRNQTLSNTHPSHCQRNGDVCGTLQLKELTFHSVVYHLPCLFYRYTKLILSCLCCAMQHTYPQDQR